MSDKRALDIFIRQRVSLGMIEHLESTAKTVIRCDAPAQGCLPSPPSTPPPGDHQSTANPNLPSLRSFITTLVTRSNVQTATLMSSLAYLARLRSRLPPMAKGMPCTTHRIFLACLILAAKYLNDSSPKNKHWARYTEGLFSVQEVNLMEKQLLYLLDWDLRITDEDLYEQLAPFLHPIKTQLRRKEQEQLRIQRQIQLQQQQQQQQMGSYANWGNYYNNNHSLTPSSSSLSLNSNTSANTPPLLVHSNSSSTVSSSISSNSLSSGCLSSHSSMEDFDVEAKTPPEHIPYPTHHQHSIRRHLRRSSSTAAYKNVQRPVRCLPVVSPTKPADVHLPLQQSQPIIVDTPPTYDVNHSTHSASQKKKLLSRFWSKEQFLQHRVPRAQA